MQNIRLVMKFGGSSVQDYAAMQQVAGIVAVNRAREMLVVTSALAGVTDTLIEMANAIQAHNRAGVEANILELETRHTTIWSALGQHEGLLDSQENQFRTLLSEIREEASELLAVGQLLPQQRDNILAFGEMLASVLLCAVFKKKGLPAVWFDAPTGLRTDASYGKAQPLMPESRRATKLHLEPLMRAESIIVTQGFIGADAYGRITTLGRGGSDYTAAIFGAVLDADRIEIWTDVDGVMTADPRLVPTAQKLDDLSFVEASELAYFGAKVLHPATILPAIAKNIPVVVRNTKNPASLGTKIEATPSRAETPAVRAIANKKGIIVINITSTRMLMAYGFLEKVFAIFSLYKTPVDLVTTSEVSVSLSIDDDSNLDNIQQALEQIAEVEILRNQAIICLVGHALRDVPGIAARVFTAIQPINPQIISRGASKVNLSFTVAAHEMVETVRKLHTVFIESREHESTQTERP